MAKKRKASSSTRGKRGTKTRQGKALKKASGITHSSRRRRAGGSYSTRAGK